MFVDKVEVVSVDILPISYVKLHLRVFTTTKISLDQIKFVILCGQISSW